MLAHEAGIFSKVSHENFAKVWHKCIFSPCTSRHGTGVAGWVSGSCDPRANLRNSRVDFGVHGEASSWLRGKL